MAIWDSRRPGFGKRGARDNDDGHADMTVRELLSAISETEYPQYIMDAIARVQAWLLDMVNEPSEKGMDPVTAMFEDAGDLDMEKLFEDLESIEQHADIIPNTRKPEGRPDVIVVSVNPPDYECGLRTAIDYAAIFNRERSKRVWVISDTFVFWDVVRYSAHVNALMEQGIVLRYILVSPWGWVEVPLSGSASRRFLWRGSSPDIRPAPNGQGGHRKNRDSDQEGATS
ncbi:MAG: hypothetical protein LBR38_04125 [Synergistaceae bacterium]|jgi:hypothetical protein|nr:hypothetical protein [Synergistaceae bacterium]